MNTTTIEGLEKNPLSKIKFDKKEEDMNKDQIYTDLDRTVRGSRTISVDDLSDDDMDCPKLLRKASRRRREKMTNDYPAANKLLRRSASSHLLSHFSEIAQERQLVEEQQQKNTKENIQTRKESRHALRTKIKSLERVHQEKMNELHLKFKQREEASRQNLEECPIQKQIGEKNTSLRKANDKLRRVSSEVGNKVNNDTKKDVKAPVIPQSLQQHLYHAIKRPQTLVSNDDIDSPHIDKRQRKKVNDNDVLGLITRLSSSNLLHTAQAGQLLNKSSTMSKVTGETNATFDLSQKFHSSKGRDLFQRIIG